MALVEPLLSDSDRILGAAHPYTVDVRNNLAHACREVGRHVGAEDEPLVIEVSLAKGLAGPASHQARLRREADLLEKTQGTDCGTPLSERDCSCASNQRERALAA
jgi:hypothetical protein